MKNPADSTESAGELGRLIPYIPSYQQFYNFRVISASVQRPVGIKQYKVEIQDEKGKIQLVFFRIITVSIYFSILLVLTVCSFLGSNLLQ